MNSQIISIGDELLMGDTVNTNATWMGQKLMRCGAQVSRVYTIADAYEAIQQTVHEAMQQADIVITTGGLGPTHDDITKEAVADLLGMEMVLHEPTLAYIKKRFKKRNIPFSKSNYGQAEVPDGCEVLFNKEGTAPGLWFEKEGHYLAVLPGIPREVYGLMNDKVLPKIELLAQGDDRLFTRYIRTAGVGESTLSDTVIGPLDDFLTDGLSVAFLPSPQSNMIRITTRARNEQLAHEKNRDLVQHIYNRAKAVIIGEGKDLSLSRAVGEVLSKHKLTLAVAESCSGGLMANIITDTPGSSDYFFGGVIAYSNHIKNKLLKVSQETLNAFGAVSKPVALQMAKEVAQHFGSDIGLSTTGVAGPGGGSKEKPVGTVWIGFWSKDHHFALQAFFTNDRLLNKERTVAVALETTRRMILGINPMPYGLKPQFS